MGMMINRRRVMGTSDSYIKWLKSLGCICWLPLSEEGDLLDRISGKSLELTGNGSMIWDSTYNMYKVTTPNSVNQYVAFLDNDMNAASFPDDEFTVIYTIEKITNSSSKFGNGILSPLSSDSNTQTAISPLYNGTGNTSAWPADIMKMAKCLTNDFEQNIYYNGSLNLHSKNNASEPYLPSNWSLIGSGLCVGMVRSSNPSIYTNIQFYIKDVYIFNKILTIEEIRKIQGYD